MADIFISYSKSNRELALRLSAYLESEGWSVWWDKSLGVGDAYRDEIMKQLASARAVIVIWTENSTKSDWVRAEAGRAKADGKLIPVKAPSLTYSDIPLPFGEMHTENISSLDLIKAAVVAQLAKPTTPVPPLRQVSSAFRGQVLTCSGIVGGAITLFTNLGGMLNLADWARTLVLHWHEWMTVFWIWAFSWTGIHIPKEITPILSFVLFTGMLPIGIHLSMRLKGNIPPANQSQQRNKIRIFLIGSLLYLLILFITDTVVTYNHLFQHLGIGVIILSLLIHAVPIGFVMYLTENKLWALFASVSFLACAQIIIWESKWVLVTYIVENEQLHPDESVWNYLFELSATETSIYLALYFFTVCWMAICVFTPIRELGRKLIFLLLGVITLVALNEISKLNLHQYLQAPQKPLRLHQNSHLGSLRDGPPDEQHRTASPDSTYASSNPVNPATESGLCVLELPNQAPVLAVAFLYES